MTVNNMTVNAFLALLQELENTHTGTHGAGVAQTPARLPGLARTLRDCWKAILIPTR